MTARTVQGILGVSFPAARAALEELHESGVLDRRRVDRGTDGYLAAVVFDLLALAERELASTQRRCDALRGGAFSRELDVNKIVDDPEVHDVKGQQRDLVHAGGRGDRQVELTTPRLAATLGDGRREPAPRTSDLDGNRQRIEGCFDDRESVGPTSPLVVIAGNQRPEVQLRDRNDADRGFDIRGYRAGNQHRGVQERPHAP